MPLAFQSEPVARQQTNSCTAENETTTALAIRPEGTLLQPSHRSLLEHGSLSRKAPKAIGATQVRLYRRQPGELHRSHWSGFRDYRVVVQDHNGGGAWSLGFG